MHEDLAAAVEADFPRVRQELEDLVRIASVSAPGFDAAEVRRSAEATAKILGDAGYREARLLEHDGAHPAVFAEARGPSDAPTVLLYAHHDVQPPGPAEAWRTAPFDPVEVDGRLFGRGAADDKAGIVLHAAALRVLGGEPPVNLKVFVEGEEEVGSTHVEAFMGQYRDLLTADVVVIADSGNWMPGVPSLTTSLRGLVDCVVEVQTLDTAVHSGLFGGTVPDAITVLARIIASLHDEEGNVAIPGLLTGEAHDLGLTEETVRRWTSAVDGVELIGSGNLTARMWRKPAISVLAVDAPQIAEAINQIVPRARAKISMRIPPGQDASTAMAALSDHLESAAPWGARVTVTPGVSGEALEVAADGPVVRIITDALSEAYGGDVVEIGVGGSIPIVSAFQAAWPEASIVLNGVADSTSQMHGPNESVSLADLRSAIMAQALALSVLGEGRR